ncbi:hypothetical protein GCM10009639_02580 [Kitasatospora putterlickiae]|uniref:Integral membrane protein n=1 Tax=Kitasatospora putterlickiae TaxID=221725 RepID=A0ABN1XIY6_9ACTN
MAVRESGAQIWGAAVVVGSALAVVAAYLINGAALVLVVAGIEVLLLMVYVGRRWRLLHQAPEPDRRSASRGHRTAGGLVDAAHCERCRRAREAIDARRAGRPVRDPRPHERLDRPRERRHDPAYDRAPQDGAPHDHPPRDRPPRDHPTHDRAPYERAAHERTPHDRAFERPAREWTAERAAARSHDRTTARHGAPGSAGRAVGHQ